MKSFLNKLAIFLLIAFVILMTVVMLLNYKVRQEVEAYYGNSTVNILFIGDSRTQMTIDDTILSNTMNLSRELEALNYTYLKLSVLLKDNAPIQKVYLGMSYSTLSDFNDQFLDGNFSTDLYAKYFFILSPEQKIALFKNNSGNIFSLSSSILVNGFKVIFKKNSHDRYFGNFQNNYQHTRIDEVGIRKQIQRQFYDNSRLRNFSTKNIFYFNKIVALCKAKNVPLIVFNTPMHPHYKQQVPVAYQTKFKDLVEQNQLQLLDFSGLISDEQLFASDGQHVNQQGALIATQYFNRLVDNR